MRRYWALHFVSSLYKLVGAVVILASVGIFIFMEIAGIQYLDRLTQIGVRVMADNYLGMIALPILPFLGGLIGGISIYAGGQFITLMMDIEANTRGTRSLLRKQTGLEPEYMKSVHGMWGQP